LIFQADTYIFFTKFETFSHANTLISDITSS